MLAIGAVVLVASFGYVFLFTYRDGEAAGYKDGYKQGRKDVLNQMDEISEHADRAADGLDTLAAEIDASVWG